MADVFVDREADGKIRVLVLSGVKGRIEKRFDDRGEAERFAEAKMGKRRGMVLSTLDMTPEQLAAHRERTARLAALTAQLESAAFLGTPATDRGA